MLLAMSEALHILQSTYGYPQFRGMQEEIIAHVNGGGHAFVLMPTGSGKSLCYQIPSMCRDGVGVVISPLIALMHDQLDALQQLGISVGAMNSSMTQSELAEVESKLRQGKLDMLYMAPERLVMPATIELLKTLNVALFAIDEAHCLSQWGHDFRPDYAALSILPQQFPDIPRIALTATADAPTRKDIIGKLDLAAGQSFISGFDRPNIRYTIAPRLRPKEQILEFIQSHHSEECGIIYCISRKKVDDMAEWLQARGVDALPYHAGLSAEQRREHQSRFLREENMTMVATIAFGMGIRPTAQLT